MDISSAKNILNSSMYNTTDTIERVNISSLTPEKFVEKYQKTGTPLVITGLLENEREWNLDYLCEKFGNQEFLFRNYGSARYKQDKRQWTSIGSGVDLQMMKFSEFAELLRNRKAHEDDINLGKYPLKNTPLANTKFLKTVGEKLSLTKPASDFNIYVSPSGHSSGLHYDSLDGTLIHLYGQKKVVLFPFSQTYNLYPFPIYIHLRHGLKMRCWFSQVDIEKPDFLSFPKVKVALQHKREIILNAGEVLFIPQGWWHDVTVLGDDMACSVNRFWRVYPVSRVLFSWSRWRAVLGILCALPNIVLNLISATFSTNRKQKFSKISHRI
jgi:Cupin-like domain